MTETADTLANSFHADLVAALGALTEVPKAGKVNAGQRKYTYLTLPDLLQHVRAAIAPYHLAVTQLWSTNDAGFMCLNTVLIHSSGAEWSSGSVVFDANANPQVVGSALTYYRRYSLAALVGLAGDDDNDGALAAAHKAPPERYDDMTRPVTREKVTAPPTDAWTTPQPIEPGERPEAGSPSNGRKASEKSVKMMWSMLRQTRMSDDEVREWVSIVTGRPADWHTDDLDQFEVSSVISRLKDEPPA